MMNLRSSSWRSTALVMSAALLILTACASGRNHNQASAISPRATGTAALLQASQTPPKPASAPANLNSGATPTPVSDLAPADGEESVVDVAPATPSPEAPWDDFAFVPPESMSLAALVARAAPFTSSETLTFHSIGAVGHYQTSVGGSFLQSLVQQSPCVEAEERAIPPVQSEFTVFDSIHQMSCGWEDGEMITAVLTYPDGTAEISTETAGLSYDGVYCCEAMWHRWVSPSWPVGTYRLLFEGTTTSLQAEFSVLELAQPKAVRTVYVDDTEQQSYDLLVLMGLQPEEERIVMRYIGRLSPGNEFVALYNAGGLDVYRADSYGTIVILAPALDDESSDATYAVHDEPFPDWFNSTPVEVFGGDSTVAQP